MPQGEPLVSLLTSGCYIKSSTVLMNAQHASSALSNRVPFTCFFTSGNKKKLQEERSGTVWWVWQLLYRTLTVKERAVAAVCRDQHVMSCHVMMKKKAMESPLWVVLAPNFKNFGRQRCTYNSALTVHLSSRGTVVTCSSHFPLCPPV